MEDDKIDLARELMAERRRQADAAGGSRGRGGVESRAPRTRWSERFRTARWALDIGPKTIDAYAEVIAGAKTIIWNGPMGVFEKPPFDKGTVALAKAVAASGAVSVVGGGDSEKAIKSAGVADKISHISTGGGASLEFLAGIELPGVAALER